MSVSPRIWVVVASTSALPQLVDAFVKNPAEGCGHRGFLCVIVPVVVLSSLDLGLSGPIAGNIAGDASFGEVGSIVDRPPH